MVWAGPEHRASVPSPCRSGHTLSIPVCSLARKQHGTSVSRAFIGVSLCRHDSSRHCPCDGTQSLVLLPYLKVELAQSPNSVHIVSLFGHQSLSLVILLAWTQNMIPGFTVKNIDTSARAFQGFNTTSLQQPPDKSVYTTFPCLFLKSILGYSVIFQYIRYIISNVVSLC